MNYKHASDKELIAACKRNIRQAQQELFVRFSYMMKGICLRYAQNADEAEDVLQESFIKLFRNLDNYTEKGPLGAWIRTITVNTALEYYRKNKSIKRLMDTLVLQADNPFSPDSAIEQLQLEDLLSKIQRLPDGLRAVFNLYAVEGYSHQEIGELLGVAEGTSKSSYSRARVLLRAMIDKESSSDQQLLNYAN